MSQNVNCHNKVCLSSGRPLIETHQDSISVYLSETNLLSRSFESLLCCLTLQLHLMVFKDIFKYTQIYSQSENKSANCEEKSPELD